MDRKWIRMSYRTHRALWVLAVLAVAGVVAAVGVIISNQLNQTVSVGATATIDWSPAPGATSVGVSNNFDVDLISYTGSSTNPMHLNIVVNEPCSSLTLLEGTTPLTGVTGTDSCTFESSAKGPAAPQSWTFTVTYNLAGSYSWIVVAHQS